MKQTLSEIIVKTHEHNWSVSQISGIVTNFKKMKKIYLVVMLSAISIFGFTQAYNTSIGTRFEDYNILGVTYKTGNGRDAFEGIIKTDFHNFVAFNALYELHQPIRDVDNLYIFYGGGGGLSINNDGSKRVDQNNDGAITNVDKVVRKYDSYGNVYYDYEYTSATGLGIGIDGITGVEYALTTAPFAFSFDWKPYIQIYKGFSSHFFHFGLSARYIIK